MNIDKNPVVKINFSRLDFLLDLYGINREEFICKLNDINNLKKKMSEEDVYGSAEMKLTILKRIDKVFTRGLTYYLDSSAPVKNNETSIFFRKDSFGADLTFESKKVVNSYEEKKFDIENMLDDIDMDLNRKLPVYSVSDDVRKIAFDIRERFDSIGADLIEKEKVGVVNSLRKYLSYLSRIMGEFNVFVFEHIDAPRKIEKVNFNGFFMAPNMIVLNNQKYYKREIFTLMHEFAHYLLDSEEIDDGVSEKESANLAGIERWCSDFSFYFLIKECYSEFQKIDYNDELFDKILETISDKTNLSTLALLTRLKIDSRISEVQYNECYSEYITAIRRAEERTREEFARKREEAIELGRPMPFGLKKPIESNLFLNIVKQNYFEGKMNKIEICQMLNQPFEKVEARLYQ